MNTSDEIALAGATANFLVVIAAIAIPMWQRQSTLRDARDTEKRAWERFIEAFRALVAALETVVGAENKPPREGYEQAEIELRSAMDALTTSSAAPLPVRAILNAARAQQRAAILFPHFQTLKAYGSNLLTWDALKQDIKGVRDDARSLLDRTRRLGPP